MNAVTPLEIYMWLRAIWGHARNVRLSRAELLQVQERKFRRLVAYAFEKSRYYRALMQRLHLDPRICRPEDFPILTKQEVIERFDDVVTDRRITRQALAEFLVRSSDPDELYLGRYHVLHTSGTSGTVAYFPYAKSEWIQSCCQATRLSTLRFRKRVAFVAAIRGHFAGISLVMSANRGFNKLFYNVRPYDVNVPLPQVIDDLNRFQPHCLSGYGGVIRLLAEAQERGELKISPTELANGGESLRTHDQAYIERVFGARVSNVYASSEFLYMGATLGADTGLSLLEDELAFELADDHVCVTNLYNRTLPLIRYRLNDVLVPDEGADAAPFRRVKGVVGRREENVTLVNRFGQEDFIHATIILEFLVEGLAGWQVAQHNRQSFEFRARLQRELTPLARQRALAEIDRKLREILAEKSMQNVRFEVVEVSELPADAKTGKFRMVIPPPADGFVRELRAAA